MYMFESMKISILKKFQKFMTIIIIWGYFQISWLFLNSWIFIKITNIFKFMNISTIISYFTNSWILLIFDFFHIQRDFTNLCCFFNSWTFFKSTNIFLNLLQIHNYFQVHGWFLNSWIFFKFLNIFQMHEYLPNLWSRYKFWTI